MATATATARRAVTSRTLVLEVAPYLVLIVCCATVFQHTVDDAFISFRYAHNLAVGQGLVFNPGERVEGYSNPLWVYLLALPALARLDLAIAAKLLGMCAAFGCLFLFSRSLERHFRVKPWARYTALLYLAGHVSFAYYAISGLETVLYTFLVLAIHCALLESRHLLAALATGLAAICRPEGMLLVAPLLLALALAPERRRVLMYALIPVVLLGAQMAFRHSYYGRWLPNTFYAKRTSELDLWALMREHSVVFWDGTSGWAHAHLAFGVLGVLGLVGLVCYRRVHPPTLLITAVLFFFIWYSKQDWMAFDRFHVPALPLILLYAFAALSGLGERFRIAGKPVLIGALALFLVGFSVTATAREFSQLEQGDTFEPAMSGRRYVDAAKYIRELAAPGDLVAAPEIGVIAYISGLPVLDVLGLTDDKVPVLLGPVEQWNDKTPEQLRPYAEYVLAKRPRFLLINFEQGFPDRLDPVMVSLYDGMNRTQAYSRGQRFKLNASRELAVYVAKDRSVR